MIITHISSIHPRNDIRIFFKECRNLAKAGHQINFVVADGKSYEEKDTVSILDASKKHPYRLRRMTETLYRVYKKAVSTNADDYHLHDPELLLLLPWLLKHGKVIYDDHEDIPRQILGKYWIPKYLRSAVSFISEKVGNCKN